MTDQILGTRVTYKPEMFIRKASNGMIELISKKGKLLGRFATEKYAKNSAVQRAKKFNPLPSEFYQYYEMKLRSWNNLNDEIHGRVQSGIVTRNNRATRE